MTIPRLFALMLVAIAMWGAIIFGGCRVREAFAADGAIAHMACSRPVLPMPRTVVIRPGVAPGPWRAAIAEWNTFGASTVGSARLRFIEVGQSYEADVYIVPTSGRTWVQLPCGRIESVINVGPGEDMGYWAAHELGHTLGFPDFVPGGAATMGYLNPGRCPGGYNGILSYCAPRTDWFGPDDATSVGWWF